MDGLDVSKTFAVLQNMLLRLTQEWSFEEEISEDETMANFVTELYEEKLQRSKSDS